MNTKVELLAPAGNMEALHAAVENGADAVYLGGKLFSARAQADNFDAGLLKEALEYAHARSVQLYLTMNTLVSDEEMKDALDFAVEARTAGIDGIIVQDLGFAGALRRVMPDVPLHGSTQMTIHTLEGVRELEKLGFERVVLARELSIEEAGYIARNSDLEIEVFVHGALCVCYSGQCLMSSIIGGRSGNRGKCAQPCRMPYKLIGPQEKSAGGGMPSGSGRASGAADGYKTAYLMSPKDMWSLENLDEIVRSGVHSLKIEGRMKSPEYVATVVRTYRKYLDEALMKRAEAFSLSGQSKEDGIRIEEGDIHDLLQTYNRGGFSNGYLKGRTGRDMMSFDKPNNSGIFLGSVTGYDRQGQTVTIRLQDSLAIGDGVEIWTGSGDSPGGTVSSIRVGGVQRKAAQKGEIAVVGNFRGPIQPGHKLYKTTDIELNRRARESFSGKNIKRIKIKGIAALKQDRPLELQVSDEEGHAISAGGTLLPEAAINRPLSEERLRDQLGRTGATPFEFSELRIELDEGLSLPVSEINEVRRQALEQLLALRSDRYAGVRSSEGVRLRLEEELERMKATGGRKLSVEAKKDAAIALYFYKWNGNTHYHSLGADRIYFPFSATGQPRFEELCRELRAAGTKVLLWLPSVTKGNTGKRLARFLETVSEKGGDSVEALHSLGIDGFLAGNVGAVRQIREGLGTQSSIYLAGDISMNVYNSASLREAAGMGLDSIALSAELTMRQATGLARLDIAETEAPVYGRLPLMHSEYCPVGAAAGGQDASHKCSGICAKGDFRLQDRMGIEFPVLTDRTDCRSTLLNSGNLFLPESLRELREAGVDIFRLYIWDEPPERIRELTALHRAAVAGKNLKTYEQLIGRVKAQGHTKGHYFRGV